MEGVRAGRPHEHLLAVHRRCRCNPSPIPFFPSADLDAPDVYNPTEKEMKLTLRAPEMREVTFTLKPGQLQRINTGWMNRASAVTLRSRKLGRLRFDNLAYSPYIWARIDQAP